MGAVVLVDLEFQFYKMKRIIEMNSGDGWSTMNTFNNLTVPLK